MQTNTPLATIDEIRKNIENRKINFNPDNLGEFVVSGRILEWLINDAEHLNKLNSAAMEMRKENV